MQINVVDAGVEVAVHHHRTLLSWAWLFDHSDDPDSRDADTGQRIRATYGEAAPGLRGARVSGDRGVDLMWAGDLQTSVSRSTLAVAGSPVRVARRDPVSADLGLGDDVTLWDEGAALDVPTFDADQALNDQATTAAALATLWRFGFVTFDGVAPGEASTRALASMIGPVRRTVFGDIWELAADVTSHQDSAYTTDDLGPHTDGTYLHEAPGLQLFVCQDRDGSGGDSTIVDGFAAVRRLVERDPDAASLLAAVSIPGHYVEPGVDLRAERPVIRLDGRGCLVQLSLNNYDRSPFHAGEHDEALRAAYAKLSRDVEGPARARHLEWRPGRAMIIDNWRVLHGRTGFSGSRRFLGAYLTHGDLESRRRVLELA